MSRQNHFKSFCMETGLSLCNLCLLCFLGVENFCFFATDENRSLHLLLRAELDGIVCSGATKAGKQTYALLEERVPKTKPLTKEEALAKLAKKYFTSHCPATLQDFVWWSGLSVGEARHALEMVKSDFVSATIASQTQGFDRNSSYTIRKFFGKENGNKV